MTEPDFKSKHPGSTFLCVCVGGGEGGRSKKRPVSGIVELVVVARQGLQVRVWTGSGSQGSDRVESWQTR